MTDKPNDFQRIHMIQPSSWLTAVDALAKSAGVNRSEWLYATALAKMPPDVRKAVSERALMGRPPKE